jgi:UDP-glucose-4-epimerase GalE
MPNTVLITGAMGFVGSHTARHFQSLGYRVIGIDRVYTIPDATQFLNHLYLADVLEIFDTVVRKYSPDVIVHCAGTSLVGPSMLNPGEYYDNNTSKTNALLKVLGTLKWQGAFVFSSSAAVYGLPEQVPIPENHQKNPISPYGSSKWFTETIIQDHCSAWGLRAVCLRYFNAAGADPDRELGHVADDTHLIPRIFSAHFSGRPFVINGEDYDTPDGTCIRDYVHVSDIASAHQAAAELAKTFDAGGCCVYNIGTGTGYSNLEVVQACEQYLGTRIHYEFGAVRPGDPAVLVADSTEFRNLTEWTPQNSNLSCLVSTSGAWHQKKYQVK